MGGDPRVHAVGHRGRRDDAASLGRLGGGVHLRSGHQPEQDHQEEREVVSKTSLLHQENV